jgi:hypothetical protein
MARSKQTAKKKGKKQDKEEKEEEQEDARFNSPAGHHIVLVMNYLLLILPPLPQITNYYFINV